MGRFAATLLLLAAAATARAAVPQVLNYQGKLADTSGNPLTGTYSFQFNVWSALSGGTELFSEPWLGANAVSVVNGIYTIQIGAQTAGGIPAAVFANPNVWLEIQVAAGPTLAGNETLSPREPLAASAYAIHALQAEQLAVGVFIASFTASGQMHFPYGVSAGSAAFTSSVTAGSFSGDGAALTNLTAASIAPGALGPNVVASSVAAAGVTPGSYGDAAHVGQFTVGADGRVTSASSVLTASAAGETNTYTSTKTFTTSVGLATQSGSVGIGTAAPLNNLDIAGLSGTVLGFDVSGGMIRIKANGNVLVNIKP